MTIAAKIMRHLKILPEAKQAEVLDFVEYLESKKTFRQGEDADWRALSLSQAMRGMETEKSPYSLKDLKEKFK